MNKILMLLIAISCSLGMNAQSKRDLERSIEDLKNQLAELESRYQDLRSSNARMAGRKFETESPEQVLRVKLASYEDIKKMADENIFSNHEYANLPFAGSYISLIEMYKSLDTNGGYRQEENESFKRDLDGVKEVVMSMNHTVSFKQSFDDLAHYIRTYRFAMFELARLFELAKEKEKLGEMKRSNIYNFLHDDEETDFVDKIPYAKKTLMDYIKSDDQTRKGIVRNLREFCKEAFEDFEEDASEY